MRATIKEEFKFSRSGKSVLGVGRMIVDFCEAQRENMQYPGQWQVAVDDYNVTFTRVHQKEV